jgi:hypothetical protein
VDWGSAGAQKKSAVEKKIRKNEKKKGGTRNRQVGGVRDCTAVRFQNGVGKAGSCFRGFFFSVFFFFLFRKLALTPSRNEKGKKKKMGGWGMTRKKFERRPRGEKISTAKKKLK